MPKAPKNGMVIAPKMDHGMKARFQCKDGFQLKGNTDPPFELVCSFGNWTGEPPTCQEGNFYLKENCLCEIINFI